MRPRTSPSRRPPPKSAARVHAPRPDTPAVRIARLNDAMRRSPHEHGELLIDKSLAGRGERFQRELFDTLAAYQEFYPGSDPRGHHDFGLFYIRGQAIIFQFDYRDKSDQRRMADDPADATTTHRILRLEAYQ